MASDFDILRSRATLLRERCVAAHNRLLTDTARSAVGELARSLEPRLELGSDSPRLRLLSSYTFWGDRQLGGSRRGFEKRFRRMAKPAEHDLLGRLKRSDFVAVKCVETGDEETEVRWEMLGAENENPRIAAVFNGDCSPGEVQTGQVWAGWLLEWEGDRVLAFAMKVPDEGAARLIETADQKDWHDEELDDDSAFRRMEYERDVLTQTLRPDWEQCGLGEYHYLPPGRRDHFPKRFRRQLVRRLRDELGRGPNPWHVRIARMSPEEMETELRAEMTRSRKSAATRVGRYRDEPVDDELLSRVVPDEECLNWLGLEADGTVINSVSPPVETHPVELLDLDEEWFVHTGVGPRTMIREARSILEESEQKRVEAFEEALRRHETRLRWVAVVSYVVEEHEGRRYRLLRPEYKELRKTANGLFDPVIGRLPLSRLLEDRGGTGTRIQKALDNAELGEKPYRVEDLPIYEGKLLAIRGIGPSSASDVREALKERMLEWPRDLQSAGAEADDESRREIEEGLDELEELF